MSYIQKLLDNIGSLKSSSSLLEIELKLIIDPRTKTPRFVRNNFSVEMSIEFVKDLIIKFKKSESRFAISETMNFIERGPVNTIKQLVFEKGVQKKSKKNFYTKKPITQPVFLTGSPGTVPMKFSISEETKIPETKVQPTLVRSKLRLSIFPSDKFSSLKTWRIDITLVKSIDKVNSIAEIKRIRDKLFPKNLTFENFETDAPWKYADSIELEIESLDPDSVSEESIAQVEQELASGSDKLETLSLQGKYYELASLIAPRIARTFKPPSTKGFRGIANNVVELNRYTFFADLKPNLEKFLITDKADGLRAFVHMVPKEGHAWVVTSKSSEQIDIPTADINACVVDAEMIKDNFLIFDVMMYNGGKVYQLDFEKRKEFIEKAASLGPKFYAKKFVKCPENCDIAKIAKFFRDRKKPFEYTTDGVIFTKKTGNYTRTENFKWKSSKDTTVDFLIRECPKSLLGIEPYVNHKDKTLYLLFVGIDTEMLRRINLEPLHRYKDIFPASVTKAKYVPIQFSPSSNPYAYLFWHDQKDLDKKIVELHYSVSTREWTLHKIRDDKTRDAENGIAFGNDFRIAELVWQNYFNPITDEDLKMTKEEGLKNVYFKQHGVDLYKPMRSYNSFVKEKMYKAHEGVQWAIDLAAGKGQDLFRYIRAKIPNVLFMDIDKMALNELINRKFVFANPHNSKTNKVSDRSKINIGILEANLNDDYKVTLAKIKENGLPIPSNGVPLIVCNFAIHYLVGTDTQRQNFIKLVDKLLAPKGRFIFTTFDGEKIFKLLDENDGKWDQYEGEKLKYSIHKDYMSVDFTGNNQKIKVLQPFSEDTYYTEYLVNHELLQKEFKKKGIQQEVFESFDIHQEEFKHHNKEVAKQLSDLDKQYSSLYTISSYYKA